MSQELSRLPGLWHLVPEDRLAARTERSELDDLFLCTSGLLSTQTSKLEVWRWSPINKQLRLEFQLLASVSYDVKLGLQENRLFMLMSVGGRVWLSVYDVGEHKMLSANAIQIRSDTRTIAQIPSLLMSLTSTEFFLLLILPHTQSQLRAVVYEIRLRNAQLVLQASHVQIIPLSRALSTVFADASALYVHHLESGTSYVFDCSQRLWSEQPWSSCCGRPVYERALATRHRMHKTCAGVSGDEVWRHESIYFLGPVQLCPLSQCLSQALHQYNEGVPSLRLLAARVCWEMLPPRLGFALPPDLRRFYVDQHTSKLTGRRTFCLHEICL